MGMTGNEGLTLFLLALSRPRRLLWEQNPTAFCASQCRSCLSLLYYHDVKAEEGKAAQTLIFPWFEPVFIGIVVKWTCEDLGLIYLLHSNHGIKVEKGNGSIKF